MKKPSGLVVNRILTSLGTITLGWLALDHMALKSKADELMVESRLSRAGFNALVRLQVKQCDLLKEVAKKLEVDTRFYDCNKDYEIR